jgi:pimeloyl-ACP methyl ester carboxylesterase
MFAIKYADVPKRNAQRRALVWAVTRQAQSLAMNSPPDDLPKPKVMLLDASRSIAYVERGAGSDLVFVHGSLCDYRYWRPQLLALSTQFRVLAPSLSHYYPRLPSAAGTPFSWVGHTDQIAGFLQRLEHRPVHLIGHSRGACIAYQAALRHGNLIRSLTLVDPAGPIETDASIEGDLPPEDRSTRARAVELIAAGFIDEGLRVFVDSTSRAGFWDRSAEVFKNMARDNAATLAPQLRDPLPVYRQSDAQQLACTTLIIDGERSPAIYRNNAAMLSRWIVNAQRTTIASASHGMTWTHPQAFDRELSQFLTTID